MRQWPSGCFDDGADRKERSVSTDRVVSVKFVSAATSRDPVTVYARHVVSGKTLAGRMVRLAAARHLRDLDRQGKKHFPWSFNAPRAAECYTFYREFLTLDDGSPFELMLWLKFIFGSLEGWTDGGDDNQRFQTAYIETSKGTGKTPAAAGYGIYAVAGKGEINAEVYSLGVIGDQASYLFQFGKRMAERSDDLQDVLVIGERNIAWVEQSNFFRPLASEGKSLDNKRPYLALVDELHEHPSDVIPSKMRLGFKGRKNALLFEITNAGHDKTSVCWQHHEYTVKVLEGRVTGPAADRWFGYICQLDPCDKHRTDGFIQPADGCQQCDQWTNPAVWLKVQPSLNVTIGEDQMAALVAEAIDRPDTQSRIKRLNFCMWTQSSKVWIQSDKWDACQRPREDLHESNTTFPSSAGFDMSEKLDLTACAVALRVNDDRPADVIEIVDNVNGEEVRHELKINFCVELRTWFWLPEATLADRVENEHIPFDVWRDTCRVCGLLKHEHVGPVTDGHVFDGWLYVTPGPVIDHDLIYEQFTGLKWFGAKKPEPTSIGARYRPQRVGYDPHNATQFAVALRDKAKYEIAEVKQGRALSETFKLFNALVRLRRIRHDGNPVMAWCVSNAEPKEDRYENIWLEKVSKTKRIDGAIAANIALNQLVLLPERRREKRQTPKVYTPDGWKEVAVPTNA